MEEKQIYTEIKNKLIDDEIYSKVKDYSKERHRVLTYFEVGKMLSEVGKYYGEGIIREYSIKLSNELGKKYSYRTLNYMIKFYNLQKVQSMTANLSWGHWIELLSINDINKINYYIRQCELYSLTTRQLREKIKLKEYERLPEKTKIKLMENFEPNIEEVLKHPIIIKNTNNYKIIICKKNNKFIMEYCSDERILSKEYELIT